jgi:hypothetical protein
MKPTLTIMTSILQSMLILLGLFLVVGPNMPSWVGIAGGVTFLLALDWRYQTSKR